MAIIHQIIRKEPNENNKTVDDLKELGDSDPLSPSVAIERATARIADEMARIHGGEWHSKIDHQRRAVMVWCSD